VTPDTRLSPSSVSTHLENPAIGMKKRNIGRQTPVQRGGKGRRKDGVGKAKGAVQERSHADQAEGCKKKERFRYRRRLGLTALGLKGVRTVVGGWSGEE